MENGTLGTFVDGNYRDGNQALQGTPVEDLTSRFRAYPIGESEREVNPDVPLAVVFCN